jgi:hypothetical protein
MMAEKVIEMLTALAFLTQQETQDNFPSIWENNKSRWRLI